MDECMDAWILLLLLLPLRLLIMIDKTTTTSQLIIGMTFPVLADNEWPHSSPAIDFTAWLKDAATAFRGHLAATFKGQV